MSSRKADTKRAFSLTDKDFWLSPVDGSYVADKCYYTNFHAAVHNGMIGMIPQDVLNDFEKQEWFMEDDDRDTVLHLLFRSKSVSNAKAALDKLIPELTLRELLFSNIPLRTIMHDVAAAGHVGMFPEQAVSMEKKDWLMVDSENGRTILHELFLSNAYQDVPPHIFREMTFEDWMMKDKDGITILRSIHHHAHLMKVFDFRNRHISLKEFSELWAQVPTVFKSTADLSRRYQNLLMARMKKPPANDKRLKL